METYNDLKFEAATDSQLKTWAALNHIEWRKTKATHCPWRAFNKKGNGFELCGIGHTLKDCLWMAYQIIVTIQKKSLDNIEAEHEKYLTEVRDAR